MRKLHVICDGCDVATYLNEGEEHPPGWKDVELAWRGFTGWPTCRVDGTYRVDLCKNCAGTLSARVAHPNTWLRAEMPAKVG